MNALNNKPVAYRYRPYRRHQKARAEAAREDVIDAVANEVAPTEAQSDVAMAPIHQPMPAVPAVVDRPDPVTDARPPRDSLRWDTLPRLAEVVTGHVLAGAPLRGFLGHRAASNGFDLLRTRLLQTLRANGWTRIAVVSPTAGCGCTFTAVNLALSLSRLPHCRTVLIDLNQRNPGVARALDLDGRGDIQKMLRGQIPIGEHLVRANDNLALGLNAAPRRDAAEVLHDGETAQTLTRMQTALRPDVVIFDLPPMLAHDDLTAFLPQVDGVLLVADGTRTTARHLAACERILDGQAKLLGVILNRGRVPASDVYAT